MAPRRTPDRAPLRSRSQREPIEQRIRRDDVADERYIRRSQRYGSTSNSRFNNDFDRDLAAMKRVWQMIRQGAVRMVGEVGRQY